MCDEKVQEQKMTKVFLAVKWCLEFSYFPQGKRKSLERKEYLSGVYQLAKTY